jgi:hypothetical protein
MNQINEIEEVLKVSADKINETEVLKRILDIAKVKLIFKPINKYEAVEGDSFKREYFINGNGQIVKGLIVFSEDISRELEELNGCLYKDVFLLEDGSLKIYKCYFETQWLRNGMISEKAAWYEVQDQTLDRTIISGVVNGILTMLKQKD